MRQIELFDRGVLINPNGVAFCSPDSSESLTYLQTQELTHRVAAALLRDGVGPQDPVAVLSPNSVSVFPYVLGVMRAGAAWMQVNARSAAGELADLLTLVDCRFMFVAEELAELVEQIRGLAPGIQHVVIIGTPEANAWLEPTGVLVAPLDPDPEGIASMQGTGGTTGRSKAVVLSHRALEAMTLAFLAHMNEPAPVHLVAAPLTHAAGCVVFPVLAVGGTNVVHTKVDAAEILASIERNRVTRLYLPPTAIYSLLAHEEVRQHDYSSLRYFLYAAAPMSVAKLEVAMDIFGPVMTQCYGQAEAPMLCTFFSPEDHAAAVTSGGDRGRLASCGKPSVVAIVAVMDDDGAILDGGTGEIVVRGSLTMTGYFRDPAQTAAASRPGGWHATGDVGYVDEHGFVYIVDRKRDMIISGGFNVFPSEVEQVIWRDDAVQDCAVIGLPDERWGESVTAIVELKPGRTLDPAAIVATCKRELGSVKAPKQVIFQDLPRSPVGKVLKRELRDAYWKDKERQV